MANEHIEEVGLKFKADGSVDYQNTLKSINNEMNQLYAEYVRDTAELDKNATATEKLTAKKRLLEQQYEAQKQKVSVLRSELDTLTKTEGANEAAIIKKKKELTYAEAKLTQYDKSLESVTDELKKHSQWTDKASASLKEFGEKTESAGEKASIASAAIVAGGIASAKVAGDLEAAANRYVAATGRSIDETEKYKSVMEGIYKAGYGEGYDDIARSMQTVSQIMGDLPTDVLQATVEKAYTLQDAFDIDLQEGIRGVDSLVKQFGISAEQAFDLIAKGAQNGLNQNNDLADQIAEYSVYFADLGYSATEFFDIMYSGAKDGAYQIDYLNDVIKEFGIRTKDNSTATTEAFTALGLNAEQMTAAFAAGGEQASNAMQMVNARLFSMNDTVKQNEIGVALYGTKWEDLGVSAVTSLANVDTSLGNTNGTMATLQETMYSGVNVQWEAFQRSLTSVVATIGEALLPALMSVLEWVSGVVDRFAAWFTGLSEGEKTVLLIITGVIAAVGPLLVIIGKLSTGISAIIAFVPKITSGISSIGKVFTGFTSLIAAHPVVAAITAVIAIIVLLWNNCEWFRDLVKALWEWLKNTFNSLVEWFKGAFNAIGSALSSLYNNVIKPVVDGIVDTFNSWLEFVKSVFLAGFTFAIDSIKGVFTSLFDSVKAIWEDIKGIFGGIIDFIKSVFTGNWKGAWEAVVNVFGSVFSLIGNIVKAPINAVISIINGAINGINKLAINIPDWVPFVGGKRLGFNIPNIPLLAKGGELISGMAIVAEAGPELISQSGGKTTVTPLSGRSRNTPIGGDLTDDSIARLVSAFIRALRDSGLLNVTIQLDERELGRLVRALL